MLPFIREKTYKLPITCRLEAWENMAKQIISTINEHYRKKDESTLQCPQSAAKRTDDDMPANLESCGSVTEKRLKSFQKLCKCSCCRLSMFMLSIIRSSCRNVSATQTSPCRTRSMVSLVRRTFGLGTRKGVVQRNSATNFWRRCP